MIRPGRAVERRDDACLVRRMFDDHELAHHAHVFVLEDVTVVHVGRVRVA